ncbi:MAG TPA: MoaD/ThiS family protein [Tepidisphaeraceae bacterium]
MKLFAVLRDAAGTGALDLDVPAGARAGAVRPLLAAAFPALERYLPRTALAVNRSYATTETELRDGDEVALIPPVSGG